MRVNTDRTDFSGWREIAAKEFPTVEYVETKIDRLSGQITAERFGDDHEINVFVSGIVSHRESDPQLRVYMQIQRNALRFIHKRRAWVEAMKGGDNGNRKRKRK